MSLFSYHVRDRNVYATSASDGTGVWFLPWTPDLVGYDGQTMPWAAPEYPTLLITGIGATLTADATVTNRRFTLKIDQDGGSILEWSAGSNITAGTTRRQEFAAGVSVATPLAGTTIRDPLPRGFMLIPDFVNPAQLTVSVANFQVGDVLGDLSVRGVLLYP